MNGFDLFKMAIGNLLRRKSRTFLTVMGIVIGTISIVVMIALGLGMQESVNSQFTSQASASIIEVTKGDNVNTTTRLSESKENDNLQDLDIEFFKSIEGVQAVSPVVTSNIKIASGKYEGTFQVMGLDSTMMALLGYEVVDGRLPTSEDDTGIFFGTTALEGFDEVDDTSGSQNAMAQGDSSKMRTGMGMAMPPGGFGMEAEEEANYNVDIFSDRMTMSFDMSYSPQGGNTITKSDIYRVDGVGILEEGDMQRDRYVYMDIDVLNGLIEDYNDAVGDETEDGYDSAYIMVLDMENIDSIEAYIEQYGYSTSTFASFLETMQGTTETLTIVLGAIGAVSLLVAAIGITNTMIMAIHERKKEIGVMKVIGATIRDIKYLFLTEAAMIGFMGGIIGIGLSYAASTILSSGAFSSVATGQGMRGPMSAMSNLNIVLPSWLIITGLVFTTLVGIISGYIPAQQAMKSSALEAIRTE